MELFGYLPVKVVGNMGKKYSFKVRLLCLFFLFIVLSLGLFSSIITVQSFNEQFDNEIRKEEQRPQQESVVTINNRYVGNALTVYSKENFLYVFEENNMLRVYDLSEPAFPKVINSMSIETDDYQFITIENGILNIPNRGGTRLKMDSSYYHPSYSNVDAFVDIYNLTDPYNIEKIGEFLILGQLTNFHIDNNFVYVYRYLNFINHTYDGYSFHLEMTNFTLSVYNVTNPTNVALKTNYNYLTKYGYLQAVSGNIAYYFNYSYGQSNVLHLLNFTDFYEPKTIGSLTIYSILDFRILEDKLIILGRNGPSPNSAFTRFYSLDDLSNLELLYTLNHTQTYGGIEVFNEILYFIVGKNLEAYNISEPINPELLFKFTSETYIIIISASIDFVFIVSRDRSITVYDISSLNPKSLTNYQRILIYCGIGLLFLIIPVFHFLYEKYMPKKIEPQESNKEKNSEDTEKESKYKLFILMSDRHPFNLIYSGFVIFAVQNGIMAICLIAIIFSFLDSYYEQYWTNILFNILFFADLIFALIFAIALILLYLMYRHKLALICAFVWLAWFCVTFAYRYYIGLPNYYPQIAYDLDYYSFRTISGLFAANVIILWFGFYLMSKYLENFGIKHTLSFTIYGYFNLILGFLISLGFIYGNEFAYAENLGIAFIVGIVFKSIFLPVIAMIIGSVTSYDIRAKKIK